MPLGELILLSVAGIAVISVGGTTEPVVTSILTHQPDFVCFFASQQSLDTIGEIKRQIKEQGLSIEDYKVVCDDVNDLVHCYQKAVECTERLCASRCDQSSVVVDYTGGTKTMTAALTLATVAHGYSFSYVGGEKRTKNGLGVVISGHEVVRTGVSPWQIFAVEEKKRIALFIATFQYEAAIATMRQTLGNLQTGESEVWSGIAETLEGFLAWDNFDHKTAVKRLSSGIHKLGLCERFGLEKPVGEYLQKTRDNFAILNKMNDETTFFAKMHPVFVGDLVANAGRRAQQSKYDDAVARLYRALEMIGQIAFTEQTGCYTNDVDPRKAAGGARRGLRSPTPVRSRWQSEAWPFCHLSSAQGNGTPAGSKVFRTRAGFEGAAQCAQQLDSGSWRDPHH